MLDLAPETESRVQEYAGRESINADEAINWLLRSVIPRLCPVPAGGPVLQFLLVNLHARTKTVRVV